MTSDFRVQARLGVAAMIGACVIWGLSPLYYRLLTGIPPVDILAHRTLWSFVFFALILARQGRMRELGSVIADRSRIGWVALAALMISINWFLFIYAIQIDRVTETSLGYYIFPLVSVLFGALVFSERLAPVQWLAVALAALGVVLISAGLGGAPWISLVLAVTFGTYGLLKKLVATGPLLSVTAEIALVLPLALLWLGLLSDTGWPGAGAMALLVLSGPLTALPLMLFSYATKRIRLATVGLLQYINPTLQFLIAVAVISEPVTIWHMFAFPLIWTALAIYSAVSFAEERKARRMETASPTSAAV